MIGVFKDVRPNDWVFCSWRSHYQCLLKGVPEDELHGRDRRRALDLALLSEVPRLLVGDRRRRAADRRRRGDAGPAQRRRRARPLLHGRDDRPRAASPTSRSSTAAITSCRSASSSRTTRSRSAPIRGRPGTSHASASSTSRTDTTSTSSTTATRPSTRTPAPASGSSFERIAPMKYFDELKRSMEFLAAGSRAPSSSARPSPFPARR